MYITVNSYRKNVSETDMDGNCLGKVANHFSNLIQGKIMCLHGTSVESQTPISFSDTISGRVGTHL